jgi:hypothetical protein
MWRGISDLGGFCRIVGLTDFTQIENSRFLAPARCAFALRLMQKAGNDLQNGEWLETRGLLVDDCVRGVNND